MAKAGYTGIELVGEWRKWSDDDVTKVVARLKGLGLRVDSMAGVKGSFADPDTIDALLADLGLAFAMAHKLGCTQIILTTGKRVAKSSFDVCVENLKKIAVIAEKANIEIVIEPIDLLENATSFLTSVTEGFQMARAVGSPKIKVLYDVYHEQRQAGNLLEKFEKNIDLVALVHIADVPGRHEPGDGRDQLCGDLQAAGQAEVHGLYLHGVLPDGRCGNAAAGGAGRSDTTVVGSQFSVGEAYGLAWGDVRCGVGAVAPACFGAGSGLGVCMGARVGITTLR